MKIKTYLSIILCVLLLSCLLTGCGGASKMSGASADAAAPAAIELEANNESVSLTGSGSTGSTVLPESRKWIVTVNMSAETEDLDAMTAALDERIAALNGYVEDQQIYNGSTYSSRRYRSAYLTIRIPAEDVEDFTGEVSGIANVVSKQTSREDVTLSYVATESRMSALQTEEARLLELMSQAETMSDLLEIEARLTDVRYELESVTSQLRLYDNQIDYATIYLDIEEVQEYTPVEEPTFWERVRDGFRSSLKGLGESILDLLVFLIVILPYLVVYGGIILVIVLLVRHIRKRRREKHSKDQPEQA